MKKVLVAIMLASLVALAAAPAFAGAKRALAAAHKRARNYDYAQIDAVISPVAYKDEFVAEDKFEGRHITSDWTREIFSFSQWLAPTGHVQIPQSH